MTPTPGLLPLAGGCQCGEVRYEVRAKPMGFWACHCTECRRQSASAFGLSLIVPLDSFAITRGTPSTWRRTAESGNIVDCLFCATCGSRIAHRRHDHQGRITLKAGTLDDLGEMAPQRHVFTDTALPWVRMLFEDDHAAR
jgi:hypothetical protein